MWACCCLCTACYLQTSKLGRSAYRDVIGHCEEALVINAASIKALYRKGVALYHIQRYTDAIEVLTQASQLPDPQRTSLGTMSDTNHICLSLFLAVSRSIRGSVI